MPAPKRSFPRQRFLHILFGVSKVVAGIGLISVSVLTTLTILAREVLNSTIPDSFEIAQHLMAISLFWGMVLIFEDGELISLDLIFDRFSPKVQQACNHLSGLTTIVVLSVLAVQIGKSLADDALISQVTTELLLPVWPFYLVALFGLIATNLAIFLKWSLIIHPVKGAIDDA